jgi:thiamine biosynthesis lipoprotein
VSLLVVVTALLTACSSRLEITEFNGAVMGTTYTVKVVDEIPRGDRDSLGAEIDTVLRSVDRRMSTYRDDSELSQFNAAQQTGWIPVSRELLQVMQEALRVSATSRGAFDVTVGPLVNLWGFGPDHIQDVVPSAADIAQARQRVGYTRIELRETPPAMRKQRVDLYVDLSAIAKGYAVDQLAAHLDQRGFENYMVEIGGEIRGKGRNQRGTAWRIAIEKPVADGRELYTVIEIDNISLATSGDYRNYFEKDGKRFSHTIDPVSGYPITHKLASVTVLDASAMRADAMATALMVLGPEVGFTLAEQQGLAAFFIVKAGQGFEDRSTSAFLRHQPQRGGA